MLGTEPSQRLVLMIWHPESSPHSTSSIRIRTTHQVRPIIASICTSVFISPLVSFNAFNALDPVNNTHVDVQEDHFELVREIGSASAVLLKNTNQALPLKKPRNIVLIGNDAGPARNGPNGFGDRGGDDGILAMGWGSGTAQFPYLISPLEAIQARARKDRSNVDWFLNNFDLNGAANAARQRAVAVSCASVPPCGCLTNCFADRFRER